jgi:alpha-tubulin suppressor-like RCC1 family protein
MILFLKYLFIRKYNMKRFTQILFMGITVYLLSACGSNGTRGIIDTLMARISSSYYDTIIIKNDGTLWGWGYNGEDQLGLGDSAESLYLTPTEINTGTNWIGISASAYTTIALKNDGTLWGWGSNTNNNFGLGEAFYGRYTTPIQLGTDTDWVFVSYPHSHVIALKNDGTLWGWQDNQQGQLGLGYIGEHNTSKHQIGTDTDWQIALAGGSHTVALKNDGTLWGWGDNTYGQLGDDNTSNHLVPTQIGTDTNWSMIYVGFAATYAIKDDGSLWATGNNVWGQLGLDTSDFSVNTLTQIGTDTNWTTVSSYNFHTMAIKNDGTLWGWGRNVRGQLGIGTTFQKQLSPIQIGTDTDWIAVSTGDEHTIALKSDGTVWGWGDNTYGQLGDDNTSNHLVPTLINNIHLNN